ncbi:MAG: vanadium-dependent haloperoxidase [Pseudomonadota bacterium]
MTQVSRFSRRAFLSSAVAAAALPSWASATGPSYIAGVVSGGNMTPVFQWSDAMLQAVRDKGIAPPPATRLFAMGHLAGFVAADAINGEYQLPFRLPEPPAKADPAIAYGAAVSTALSRTAGLNTRAQLNGFLAGYPDGEGKGHGVSWGEYVGNAIVNWREDDGIKFARSQSYNKLSGPLAWEPTGPFYGAKNGPAFKPYADALLPGWGKLSPWSVADVTVFRPRDFPDYSSREFERQLQKVHALGSSNSTERTADQAEIAFFWEDGPRGVTPPGHWQIIAMDLLQRRSMGLSEQARAMAMLSMAQADAGIATWDCKFAMDVVRPETVMRKGAINTPLAQSLYDPNWMTLIPTPPFPAYTSGHSMFSSTSARMIAKIIGRDRVNFSGAAPDLINWPSQLTGVRRSWTRLSQAAEEGGMSREYGGIHWEADNTEGMRLGRAIADEVFRRGVRRA